ncbi:MAG TPA: BrnA antitoxin family protein [Coxiellaceae bacterium]|nr:BrnA antitoxin family protein [Coxiellaceae bacterium]
MKKEYNLKKLRVKRRGVLPALKKQKTKVRITISLDKTVIDYFKLKAEKPGASPYQTQINRMLCQLIEGRGTGIEVDDLDGIKSELLRDRLFIDELAKQINRSHHEK